MSPVVFRYRGYRFHFFANEGNPREPAHIHATKDGIDAKFWLWPDVTVAYNDGHDARVMKELEAFIRERRSELDRRWRDFFGRAN